MLRALREPLLAFNVCGAAIVMGKQYPMAPELKGLQLLGQCSVHYHACESISSIAVSEDPNVLQMAPGVANILYFQNDVIQNACEVISKNSPTKCYPFAEQSAAHIARVLRVVTGDWRGYFDAKVGHWWCRADGVVRFQASNPDPKTWEEFGNHQSFFFFYESGYISFPAT